MKTEKQQAAAAMAFAQRWMGKGYEKGDSQPFWIELLSEVFGIENPASYIRFEEQVKVDKTNFIDGHIPSTKVLIEQKSIGKNLREAITQSDGSRLNPFQQAKRYAAEMPYSQRPRWIVTCNFTEFLVYDMERPHSEPESILLKDLGKEYYRLQFLVNEKSEHITKEMQVSMQAGEIVGRIYEALLHSLTPGISPTGEGSGYNRDEMLHSLNRLCVQIVFCLYAEDAGVFAHDQFHDYLVQFSAKEMRRAIINLFDVLSTPYEERDPFLEEDLAAFPYVNGGLFSNNTPAPSERGKGTRIIPQFTDELQTILLQNASLDFDWSEISPTIFGAVFESTLNPETRRRGGMHYTSIENIHKVIDPLFLNDLRREFNEILEEKTERQRNRRLDAFQDKLASLKFLDPACGSGNFLTETYLSLRRLENELIRERYHGQTFLGLEEVNPVKVSINQFYGIEINDFAVTVATTALWISEAQMLAETERIIHHDIDFLPLKSYSNIREGNALRMDWGIMEYDSDIPTIHAKNTYVVFENEPSMANESFPEYQALNLVTNRMEYGPKPPTRVAVHYDYIIGNPPFVGARWMNREQKSDVLNVFGAKWNGVGDLDYVACWLMKAALIMTHSDTRAAFVATNSITQGAAVANIWKPLNRMGVKIDFAWRTFRWDSESSMKAHVHCVIIGFSRSSYIREKVIFVNGQQKLTTDHINGYLIGAPDIYIEKRLKPICDVPQMCLGGQPLDDGNLILTEEEKEGLIRMEPQAALWIRPFMMGKDFIDRKPRYCIWLMGADPKLLRSCPHIMERIKNVKTFRLNSNRKSTLRAAECPTLFGAPFECLSHYVALPKVSSENRKYIPIDYLTPDIIPGDKLFCMLDASLYHFGVLTSNVHMAWMRAVCGRLKSDYSYSNTIVYNNFPWPSPSEEQKASVERTAQAILDARSMYHDSSLADLYDDLAMPPELRRAHQDNDRAVMKAYGFDVRTMTESQCVAELFKLYQQLTQNINHQ